MVELKLKHIITHKTKKEVLFRYLILILILVLYFVFISWHYGISNGFIVTTITWSCFVFCTPIADAGFLIDFPVRLLLNIRMLYSEIFVWIIAFIINVICVLFLPYIYQTNLLTKIFYQILTNPFPYWLIILFSALGTFFSVIFGDELLDVAKHRKRKIFYKHGFLSRIIFSVSIFIGIVIVYSILVKQLNIVF